MTIELVTFPAEELPAWLENQRAEYRAHRIAAGDDEEAATRRAHESQATYFAGGRPAAGHEVFSVHQNGERVGVLWVGPHPDGLDGVAWVWDIEIDAAQRGKGFGRATMRAAEEWARDAGYESLALNVFGFNTVARSLYESMGFETTSLQMRKAL